jgi:dipeptidyl aminopeptidase/acylaminoacyl peptidase
MKAASRLLGAVVMAALVGVSAGRVSAEERPGQSLASVYAQLPAIVSPQISPDGSRIAAFLPVDGRYRASLRDAAPGAAPVLIDFGEDGVSWLRWESQDWLLVGWWRKTGRDGEGRVRGQSFLTAVSADGKRRRPVLSPRNRNSPQILSHDVIDYLWDRPGTILVAVDRSRTGLPDVLEVDIESGQSRRIERGSGRIVDWLSDANGVVRLSVAFEKRRKIISVRDSAGGKWRVLSDIDVFEAPRFQPLAFTNDPNVIYVGSDHENGRMGLYRYDLARGAFIERLFLHEKVDVDRFALRDRRALFADYVVASDERVFFDAQAAEDQRWIDAQRPGRINRIVSYSDDLARFIVESGLPEGPVSYALMSRDEAPISLGEQFPGIDERDLARVIPLALQARDGLALDAYVTLPPPLRDLAQARDLPFLILPHGGPAVRDSVAFDYIAQYAARLGYGVLQVNYRGSSGYGRAHLRAGDRQRGLAIQDDVTDAVNHLLGLGVADASRLCIGGGSFGGYIALMGALRTPALYRCAVSINGVADLRREVREFRRSPHREILLESVAAERQQLEETSPVARAASLAVPLLVIHGEDDQIVPPAHARDLVRALAAAGIAHEAHFLPGGDHTLSNPTDRAFMLETLGGFLKRHLGPSFIGGSGRGEG